MGWYDVIPFQSIKDQDMLNVLSLFYVIFNKWVMDIMTRALKQNVWENTHNN
jgi:hypothetical protein